MHVNQKLWKISKNDYTKLNYEAVKTYNNCISRSSPSNKARQIFVQDNSKPVIHSCIYYCCNSGRFLLRRPVRCRPDAARQFTYRQSHNSSWRPFKTTILSGGSRSGSNPSARWRCDHKHRNCITICRPVALGRGETNPRQYRRHGGRGFANQGRRRTR